MILVSIFSSISFADVCEDKQKSYEEEVQAIINEMRLELESLKADKNDFSQDLNLDGKSDITYENSEFSYFQLVDRNFDGKPDERYEYDNGTDLVIDGRLDEDFDGLFETQLVMSQGIVLFEFVDINNDRIIDVAKSYNNGVLQFLDIYISAKAGNEAQIKTISFEFGVPFKTAVVSTMMSPNDFHLSQLKKIPRQKMQQS